MLELQGIYAPMCEISFLKMSIFHHPREFGKEIRLVFNIILKAPTHTSAARLPEELEIFMNASPGVEIIGIEDLSHKLDREHMINIGAVRITNIPKNGEEIQRKFPYHFDSKSGSIKINLELADRDREKNAEIEEEMRGMIFFALHLKGNFLEEDPWWKKLLGLSKYAWKFSYTFWSHGDRDLIRAQSIGECKEAQVFIVIPRKMISTIDRVFSMPGIDQLHEITKQDIVASCEFESEEEKIKNIKEWIEPGSFSLAWWIPATLKLSKKIITGHLDAFSPSIVTLGFCFFILLCWLFGISLGKYDPLQYIVLIVLYL